MTQLAGQSGEIGYVSCQGMISQSHHAHIGASSRCGSSSSSSCASSNGHCGSCGNSGPAQRSSGGLPAPGVEICTAAGLSAAWHEPQPMPGQKVHAASQLSLHLQMQHCCCFHAGRQHSAQQAALMACMQRAVTCNHNARVQMLLRNKQPVGTAAHLQHPGGRVEVVPDRCNALHSLEVAHQQAALLADGAAEDL